VDKKLQQILNDTYGAKIENFTLSPIGVPRTRGEGTQTYHRLSAALEDFSQHVDDYGEGVRNALASLIIASQLHHTALLLEEPEVHQHSSALRLFLTALCKIAHENGLQLFITTHSLDVISCLAQLDGSAIFHLELDATGHLNTRRVTNPDARMLMDLGVNPLLDEIYVVVEGRHDRVFWESVLMKLHQKETKEMPYRFVLASKNEQQIAVAAIAQLGKAIIVLRDYDNVPQDSVIVNAFENSLKQARSFKVETNENRLKVMDTGAEILIIPQGLPTDEDLEKVGVKSHSVEDYCLKLLAIDDKTHNWIGMNLAQLRTEADPFKNAKMNLSSSKTLFAILSALKKSDVEDLIASIVEKCSPEKLTQVLGENPKKAFGW
jgi:5S rRNA maturation endonuclease (ribonuclease M5)